MHECWLKLFWSGEYSSFRVSLIYVESPFGEKRRFCSAKSIAFVKKSKRKSKIMHHLYKFAFVQNLGSFSFRVSLIYVESPFGEKRRFCSAKSIDYLKKPKRKPSLCILPCSFSFRGSLVYVERLICEKWRFCSAKSKAFVKKPKRKPAFVHSAWEFCRLSSERASLVHPLSSFAWAKLAGVADKALSVKKAQSQTRNA